MLAKILAWHNNGLIQLQWHALARFQDEETFTYLLCSQRTSD